MISAPSQPSARSASWLQTAVAAGAAVRTLHVGRRLGPKDDGVAAQERMRRRLLPYLARTAFGRTAGIEPSLPYSAFNHRIAPRSYETCVPWIERMLAGEPDVLWPGRCEHFAVSSGTTQGRTKYLPVTPAMLAHFRRAGLDSLCLYARRIPHSRIFGGRQLFLGGSTALTPLRHANGFTAWCGDLSGITAANMPGWAQQHLYEPGAAIAQIPDWPEKLQAIAQRTATRDVRLLAGIPSWLLVFAETMRDRTGRVTLRESWPNLECLVHGGVPIDPFRRELGSVLGPDVNFHEVYPASEGFIAAQDDAPAAGLRLLTDAGIYYEFLPMDRFDDARLGELGPQVVPLAGVRPGVDYALLLTTPGGLCRYVIGDVVRFVSTRPPRLLYVGRTRLQLSAFGEHVIEKDLTDAIAAVCERHRLELVDFHVAPRFVDSTQGLDRGRHEWFVEFRAPVLGVLLPHLAADLDRELQARNEDYEAKRGGGGLSAPLLHVLKSGTFKAWLRQSGKWGGQHKTPRCRSDRQIADQLTTWLTPARD